MKFAITPEPHIAVPVVGTDEYFPVRRVYCVGRNYAAHAREMGFDPDREPPFFFCKPDNSVVVVPTGTTGSIAFPPESTNYQYEMELVVAIDKGGANISIEAANQHIYGYALGLDMTRRDLQIAMREIGRPWELGKAFDESAPIGPIYRASSIGHPTKGEIWLNVNGVEKQRSDINKLIWSIPEVIMHLSKYFTLAPGDLIYSGTPEGVGKVARGDVMTGGMDGFADLKVAVR